MSSAGLPWNWNIKIKSPQKSIEISVFTSLGYRENPVCLVSFTLWTWEKFCHFCMYLQNDGYRKFPNERFFFLWAIKGAKKIGKKFNICEVIFRVLHQWPTMNASLLSFFFLFGCQLWLSPSSSVLTLCMKLFLKDLLF